MMKRFRPEFRLLKFAVLNEFILYRLESISVKQSIKYKHSIPQHQGGKWPYSG